MRLRVRLLAMIVADCAVSAGSVAVAVLLRRHISLPATVSLLPAWKFPLDAINLSLAAAAFVVSLAMSGFYDWRTSARHRPLLIAALAIQVALLTIGATLLQRPYPRTILLAVPLFESLAFYPCRKLLNRVFRLRSRQTVVVGSSADLESFLGDIAGADGRFEIAGVISPARPATGSVPYLGSLTDKEARDALRAAEEVVYIGAASDSATRLHLLELRGPSGFLLAHTAADALLTAPALAWIGDKPLTEIAARAGYGSGRLIKRLFDLAGALLLSILTAPMFVIAGAAILLEDRRSVFFAQDRAGAGGRTFRMWKFRTLDRDGHVTRVGYWLRRHRIDELPQLLNVIRGEMSLVGPRPERADAVETISREVSGFELRLLVKPGMAGLAQVRGEYETSSQTKLRYDLTYICAWSLMLDVRILFSAISTSLAGRGR